MAQYPQGIFQSLQYLLKKVKILALDKQPTYIVSLASANYTIPGRGVYYVTATNNSFIFPDPSLMNGQSITIINTGASNALFSNTNGFGPKNKGTGTALSGVASGGVVTFVSINNLWIGAGLV